MFLSLTTKLIESSTIAHSDEEEERNDTHWRLVLTAISLKGLWVTFPLTFSEFQPTPLSLPLSCPTVLFKTLEGTLRTKDLIVLCSQAAEIWCFTFKFYQVVQWLVCTHFSSYNSCVNSPTPTSTPSNPGWMLGVFFLRLYNLFSLHELQKKVFLKTPFKISQIKT